MPGRLNLETADIFSLIIGKNDGIFGGPEVCFQTFIKAFPLLFKSIVLEDL